MLKRLRLSGSMTSDSDTLLLRKWGVPYNMPVTGNNRKEVLGGLDAQKALGTTLSRVLVSESYV